MGLKASFTDVLRQGGVFLAVSILAMSGVLVTAIGPAHGIEMGGELGHGKVKSFVNDVIGVELKYPENWKYMDLSSTVTFSDLASELTVTTEDQRFDRALDKIQSADALLNFLMETSDLGTVWTEVQVDGNRAFTQDSAVSGPIYVFRKPGQVLEIRFKIGESEASRRDLRLTLRSIRLKDSAF